MTNFRLILCCCLSAYSCAFSYSVLAEGLRPNENKTAEPSEMSNVSQEKFTGRANNPRDVNHKSTKAPNARNTVYAQEAREKKPLSKEERLALRRQINETENMYPKKAD